MSNNNNNKNPLPPGESVGEGVTTGFDPQNNNGKKNERSRHARFAASDKLRTSGNLIPGQQQYDQQQQPFSPKGSTTNENRGGPAMPVSGGSETPSQNSSDNDDERRSRSNDGGSSSNNESSHNSDSSGGSKSGVSNIFKKTTYLGLSISTLMSLIVLIPIIFLVVYSAIPLAEAIEAVTFLEKHNPILDAIFETAVGLEEERRGCIYMTAVEQRNYSLYPLNNTQYFQDHGNYHINHGRAATDVNLEKAIRLVIDESDAENKQEVIDAASSLLKELHISRERFDARTIETPEIRTLFSSHVAACQRLILRLVQDDRINAVESQFMILALMMRNSNSINSFFDTIVSIVFRNYKELRGNMNNLQAMESVIGRDLWMIDAMGTDEQKHAIRWRYSDIWLNRVYNSYELISPTNGNSTAVDLVLDHSWLNESSWDPVAHTFVPIVHDQLTEYRNYVAKGDALFAVATLEIVKMVVAVFVCIVTTIIVVRLNSQEQERMNAAYEGTKQLAAAVQRFVPKNQLKLMGVRSVVEVAPGDYVETAVSLSFASIRGFDAISSRFSHVDLFEWLQNYFSRSTQIVAAHHGYIDSMIGDAIFVVNNSALEGLETAMALQVNTDKLNLELVAHGGEDLVQIGCGLHFGLVVAGVFGDDSRLTCTMISPDVNLASRLEALTKSWGAKILASEAAASRLPNIDDFMWRSLGKILVKGSKHPIELYDFFQCDSVNLRDHKLQYRDKFHEAVDLVETDPDAAKRAFESIYNSGISQRKVKDHGCVRRFEGASVSPGQSVLSFEKDGVLKGSPGTLALNEIPGSHPGSAKNLNLVRSGGAAHHYHPSEIPPLGASSSKKNKNNDSLMLGGQQ